MKEIRHTGIEDYYASNDGFIFRKLKGRPHHRRKRCTIKSNGDWYWLLRPYRTGKDNNYLSIDTSLNGSKRVHRLVLMAFNKTDNNNLQCNHKDRNTFNNDIENLEWCTNKENSIHRVNTVRTKSYQDLYKEYLIKYAEKESESEFYEPKKLGSWCVKYNKDMILEMLANTSLSKQQIAVCLGCSERAVKYWQEKEKVKQYSLSDIVFLTLGEFPESTPLDISKKINVRVTSIHSVLRKLKRKQMAFK